MLRRCDENVAVFGIPHLYKMMRLSNNPVTMEFQRESITTKLIDEMRPLLQSHFVEIAHYQDIPLDPDFSTYRSAEVAGLLRVFTARMPETYELIGYAIFFVRFNLHYQASLQAVQDVLFLHPIVRGKMLGAKFISWCDEKLKAEGVQIVYHHVKSDHNFGPLLERMGYELVDYIYGRRLDK